jgi:hypothetical protein
LGLGLGLGLDPGLYLHAAGPVAAVGTQQAGCAAAALEERPWTGGETQGPVEPVRRPVRQPVRRHVQRGGRPRSLSKLLGVCSG